MRIYSSGTKDKMGCDVPQVIDFRSLPVQVQDDLMRAEILPPMWPRYKISGYERLFHYRLMTVITRAMLFEADCHNLTPGALNNVYPPSVDAQYRSWINDLLHVTGGHSDPVQQLVTSAHECAVSILTSAGADCISVVQLNAYQLDLFLFKDMGLGGVLSKFISRVSDPEIGGFEGFCMPEPIGTWHQSFYDDYMAYLKVADRDAVLGALIASPGTQVTIALIAAALEEAEAAALSQNQMLQQYLGSRAIADLVEQFTNEENHK